MILGLLSHENMTGYEIKKRMDGSLIFLGGASYGSIYPTLNDLVKRGMATKKNSDENKRNKQIYSITDAGKEYLKQWLNFPVEKDELRYETLLKIFFGNSAGPLQAIEHIDAFQKKIENGLSTLLVMEKNLLHHLQEDSTHEYYLLTCRFGVKTYLAYLEWCEEARNYLSEHDQEEK